MIGVVYLGSNPKTQERLKYIPGQSVKMMTAYKEAASICTPRFPNEHFILFFEKNEQNEDVTAIKYIRNKCKDVYINSSLQKRIYCSTTKMQNTRYWNSRFHSGNVHLTL